MAVCLPPLTGKQRFSDALSAKAVNSEERAGQRCCQSNANQSPNIKIMRISRCQLTPFGHGRSAVLLECFAWGEMTFEIEMIVDRSMN